MCVSCRREVIFIHSVHLSWSWASPRWLPTTTFCMFFSLSFLHIYFLTFSTKTSKTHAFLMISAPPGPIKYFRFLHIALLLHFAHDSLLPSRATPASCLFFMFFLFFLKMCAPCRREHVFPHLPLGVLGFELLRVHLGRRHFVPMGPPTSQKL